MSLSGFLFTSLLIFSAHFLQTCAGGALAQENPPYPQLVQVSSDVSSGVVLRCLAPQGHGGRVFELYHVRTLKLSVQFDTEHSYADFQFNTSTADSEDIYCCRYDHSMFSLYTRPTPPPRPNTPPAPPQLSVTPPDGYVRPGQVVEFRCQAPPTLAPVSFVLQKPQNMIHSQNPQFKVGPVGVADGGMYTCFYMYNLPEGVQKSVPSTPVYVNVGVKLPAPQLSQRAEGALVCTGSPSYPGAHFSLFQQGSSSPLATQHAPKIEHTVQFTASGQHWEGSGYQCQYSVLLGKNWTHSELSSPILLQCVTGSPSCSSSSTDNHPPHTGSMDLPLVCGSISAALLFLMVLIVLAFGIRKYAKTAANKRRQREQEQFWQQVHSRDHIVDLTLQRVSTGSKEEGLASGLEPIYESPISTFTRPPGY
ncbi:alpha-1B-glycoprotein-like [Ictalurus furcatus]|uniref:alpha-1B-glycoprotein-like n=1 Tax=Ictalurus furcatus TaxID=66913 RepID=UPI002350E6C2|nr:alpha-1B-glycoprotein-like [Ictalurus furcatus]